MRTILTMNHATITTKIIAVQTQILEDAADIENNMINTPKAYSTKCRVIGQKVCVTNPNKLENL